MISPRKLLLAVAISHTLVTSGYLVPSASSMKDEAFPLLGENSDKSWAVGTDLVVRDDVSSDIDFPDTNPNTNITAVQVRDENNRKYDWAGADMRRRINLAEKTAFFISYGPSVLGLYHACKNFKEEGGATNGVMCVVFAIANIWATFLLFYKAILAAIWVGNLAKNFALGKHGLETQRALDEYSALLGMEVRHLGFWNDTATPGFRNLKRSTVADNDPTPVFGISTHGFDFHFTRRGEIDGQPLMRFGFDVDDGLSDDGLGKRDRGGDYFFTKGGIDFWFDPEDSLESGGWKDDDEDFGWLVEQINCLMTDVTFWGNKMVDANGIFLQLYDNMRGSTVATAAMATFEEGGESAIMEMADMVATGGFEGNRNCMEIGNLTSGERLLKTS